VAAPRPKGNREWLGGSSEGTSYETEKGVGSIS